MPENLPKISIVTVCYNAEGFLERTIQSVIEQTYPNIEYIVVDGASKDTTLDIIKKYAAHITQWISEPDKSLYDAMNKGLHLATGDYIFYLNAGDRLKDAQTLSRAMQDANGADLVYGNAVYIDEAGNTRPWHKRTPPADELTARSFMDGMVICHHCLVVKRSLAAEYDIQWRIAADQEWIIHTMQNVQTKHYYNDTFCLFLEGGVSNKQRWKAVRERFWIQYKHFGFWATFLKQIQLVWRAIWRGSVS